MQYAFQDRENLYLVMDLLTGGDLRYHICRQRRFSEIETSKSAHVLICYPPVPIHQRQLLQGIQHRRDFSSTIGN